MTTNSEPIYTSRIIKASALIPDTLTLLSEWNTTRSVEDNLAHARHRNIFGKTSRARAEDIVNIFRQRFFTDPAVGLALVAMVKQAAPVQWITPLLYFFSAQNDRTLRDTVVNVLYPRRLAGQTAVSVDLVLGTLAEWVAEGRTTTRWGDCTTVRVAQGLLATLRDFGILEGAANKRLASVYLPVPSFAFIAHWLHGRELSGNRVLHSEEWRLFFLSVQEVERLFMEAHQRHLLHYSAAGSVVRMEFPAAGLEEYAHVLIAQRAD